jgi:hypothetical protein
MPETETHTTELDSLRVRPATVIGIVALVLSIAGSYFATSGKVDAMTRTMEALRAENAAQHATISGLVREIDTKSREQERLIVELRTTLLVRGLLR